MKLLAALELTRGGENEFWLDKMYVARVLCKKKWIKLLISGRNGGSNFLHPPIGGRHRLLYFRTNIKATNMKEIQQGNLLGVNGFYKIFKKTDIFLGGVPYTGC